MVARNMCCFHIKICVFIVAALCAAMGVFLLIVAIPQKGLNVNAVGDILAFVVYIVCAIIAIVSAVTGKKELSWPFFGALVVALVITFIAVVYHLVFCYRHRVDIFEVFFSSLFYLILMIVTGFCMFVSFRWRLYIKFAKPDKKASGSASKGTKSESKTKTGKNGKKK